MEIPPDAAADDNYNTARLLDTLAQSYLLKNDAAIARFLEITPVLVCKLRKGTIPLSAAVILRIHETTDLPIKEILKMSGDRRRRFRWSHAWDESKAATTGRLSRSLGNANAQDATVVATSPATKSGVLS